MSIAMRSIGNPVSTISIGALFFLFGGFFCDQKEVSISDKQKSDKDLTLIRKWVEKGEKPELKEITGESITVKSMWAQECP
jgi:hypothetical protein